MFRVYLDPGHTHNSNKGIHSNYAEGTQMYTLASYLFAFLSINNIHCVISRGEHENPPVYSRGTASKNYDLFISLHSNGCSSPSVDRICAIHQLSNDNSRLLASNLASAVSHTMGIDKVKIYSKSNSKGTDYYGVLRGASSVGTDGIIIEHSFHTNYQACEWLLDDANLWRLAQAECSAIIETLFALYPDRHPMGDVNMDGKVDKEDKAIIRKAILCRQTEIPETILRLGDFNKNQKIDLIDYTRLCRKIRKGE